MTNGNSMDNRDKRDNGNQRDIQDHKDVDTATDASAHEQIAAAAVTLTAAPAAEAKRPWLEQNRRNLIAFSVLVALLLGVIFLLPTAVKPIKPEEVADAVVPTKPLGNIESPWRDAQLAKERREAQEILSEMLQRQKILEEKQVERWAAEGYQQALETATAADTYYRQREFTQAQSQYRQALVLFDTLIETSKTTFSEKLQQGSDAIADGNAEVAIAAYQLARAIDPKDSQAQTGLARAQALEQVLALLHQGELQEKTANLEAAQEKYQQALSLDKDSEPARTKVTHIKERILERDFTEAMSRGYTALHNQQFDTALKAFRRVQTLKPDAAEARTGLDQARNQKTQFQIQQFVVKAEEFESREAWQQAADTYQQARGLDDSLVKARIGKIRTQARADLDKQLVSTLEQPLRLATESVYRQTQALYGDASALKNPGPRLQQQVAKLAELLQLAIQPIAIRLQSDNETDVTLYKVQHLGNFRQHEMNLKPGQYTAVGTRNGYRDVRLEFTVTPNKPQQTIVIQCVEKISLGS